MGEGVEKHRSLAGHVFLKPHYNHLMSLWSGSLISVFFVFHYHR